MVEPLPVVNQQFRSLRHGWLPDAGRHSSATKIYYAPRPVAGPKMREYSGTGGRDTLPKKAPPTPIFRPPRRLTNVAIG